MSATLAVCSLLASSLLFLPAPAAAASSPIIKTVAGTYGPFVSPGAIFLDGAGNLYIADSGNNMVQMMPKIAGTYFGIAMNANGIYRIAGSGTTGSSGDGGAATSALLYSPNGVTVDSSGNLYIADSSNNRIQFVPKASGTYFGVSMTANDIYTIAGSSAGTAGSSGDGGAATSALLGYPFGVVVDSSGNVYIADTRNNRIQFVPASSGTYFGVSMTANDIYTIAGSAAGTYGSYGNGVPATSALLYGPGQIAVAPSNNVYIADTSNSVIREVVVAATTSNVTASMGISAGTLAFVSTPASFAFTSITLNGATQTTTASVPLDIGDATGSGNGWNVTLSATTFTNAASETLADGDFQVLSSSPPTVACDTSSTCTVATLGSLYPYTLSGTGTKLLSSAANTGMGDQTVTIPWTATIPANAYAGTYTSTWTFTLVSGP